VVQYLKQVQKQGLLFFFIRENNRRERENKGKQILVCHLIKWKTVKNNINKVNKSRNWNELRNRKKKKDKTNDKLYLLILFSVHQCFPQNNNKCYSDIIYGFLFEFVCWLVFLDLIKWNACIRDAKGNNTIWMWKGLCISEKKEEIYRKWK
jgi:hypothetical protein